MTETPFKAYKAEVKFDPIKDSGEGLIASAEANQNKLLESITKRNADLFKFELADAERKDQRFDKLAKLSKTAAQIAAPLIQARTNDQLEKGAQLYHAGLAKDQELRQAEYERDEQQQLTEELVNNEIIDDAEKKGEIDPWLKDKLKKIPRLQKIGFQKALYAQEAKMYPLYREQNKSVPVLIKDSNGQLVERALEDAKDPNEWEQINQRLINGYIRPFATHNQPMVEKYLYKEMRNIEDTERQQWATATLQKITDEDNLKADNSLKNNFVSDPGSVMKYALTEQSRFGSISAAHDNAIKLISADINLGFANSDDVQALRNSKYIDKTTGEEHVYGERFPRKMAILEQALYERDKKDHETRTNKETIAFSDDVTKNRNRYIKMLEDGEELTEDIIEKDQEQMVKLYGKRSPKLDAIKQDLTVEGKEIKRQIKEVEQLADLGLLTNTKLSEYNFKIVQQYQGVAQLQTQVNTEIKEFLGDVEALVKTDAKTLPDGSLGPNARQMVRKLQSMYRQQAVKNKENDIDDPYGTAYTQVSTFFEKAKLQKTYRGYPVGLPTGDQLPAINLKINQGRQETNKWIVAGTKSLDEQDTFFSAVEISNALKGYGKPGWQPHERAVYVAKQYNIDPLDVLQRQAKAYDPSADLETPPSIKAFNEKVDKYSKLLILSEYPTYSGIARGWGSTGEVNYSIFKNADQAKEIGDELGLSDFAVEAAVETGLFAWEGEIDENASREYFQAIWKLSGGTEIQALKQLIRPKFKP